MRAGHQALHVVLDGDVAGDRRGPGTELLLERVRGLAQSTLVGVADDHGRALEQAAAGQGAADAGAGRGRDDDTLAVEQAASRRLDRCVAAAVVVGGRLVLMVPGVDRCGAASGV